jgi:hypothetical protein
VTSTWTTKPCSAGMMLLWEKHTYLAFVVVILSSQLPLRRHHRKAVRDDRHRLSLGADGVMFAVDPVISRAHVLKVPIRIYAWRACINLTLLLANGFGCFGRKTRSGIQGLWRHANLITANSEYCKLFHRLVRDNFSLMSTSGVSQV